MRKPWINTAFRLSECYPNIFVLTVISEHVETVVLVEGNYYLEACNVIIMLFGISNVGKTVTGEKLAKELNYTFLDLDEEIKKRFKTTLEKFMQDFPYPLERSKVKGKILKGLIEEHKDNIVIAVSTIHYARNFNSPLDLDEVIAIELQDSEEHIFQRLVFSDENDNIYKDDAYKEKHKDYYIRDIHEDIVRARRTLKKIENKYFIDNQSVEQVVNGLMVIIQNISRSKCGQK